MKILVKTILIIVMVLASFLAATNFWVISKTKALLYADIEKIPSKDIVLVLGTSRLNSAGQKNDYFENRMAAVTELYDHGAARHIIVSGYQTKYYNEPGDMRDALMAKGIPAEAITMDYAGLRTLDSVIRCKEVFGYSNVIIVTQKFHAFRALFIARYYKLNAIGYIAASTSVYRNRVFFREIAARAFAILDLYVFNTKPKHMSVTIDVNA